MVYQIVRKAVAAVLIACTGLFGLVGPAQATLITGSWDPPYGAPFPSLGWRGDSLFYVADDCHTTSGTLLFFQCGAGDMSVLSATVELYNINTPGTPTLQTLDFSNDMFMLATRFDANGVIDGVTAIATQLLQGDSSLPELAPVNPVYFYLAFQFIGGETTARLGYSDGQGFPIIDGWNSNAIANRATVTLQVVPEPAGLALALSALVAAGFASRRRSSGVTTTQR